MTGFTILLGGDVTPGDRLMAQIQGRRTIAADSGIRHAGPLRLEPELWVGDFDSTPEELANRYSHISRQQYPRNKDMTDGAIAIATALERGANDILLAGALGGRTDHTLSHIMQMLKLEINGTACFMTSGRQEAWPLLKGTRIIDTPAGVTFSVIALLPLAGLSLAGVKWSLNQQDVEPGSTLTQSNMTTGTVNVSLRNGQGVILLSGL